MQNNDCSKEYKLMGKSAIRQGLGQASSRAPYTITRVNQNLMERRISVAQAQEQIDTRLNVWGGTVGQFKGRLVLVDKEFVVQQDGINVRPAIGYLGGLSIAEINIGQYRDDEETGIRYVGNAVVAHLFGDITKLHESAQVVVSLPALFGHDLKPERAEFTHYTGFLY